MCNYTQTCMYVYTHVPTVSEHRRIVDLFYTHKHDGIPPDFDTTCKCAIHTSTALSLSFSELLKRIMATSAELSEDFMSGNLGNLAVQSRVLYLASRPLPRAIFPVVHKRNRCLNWFIVVPVAI